MEEGRFELTGTEQPQIRGLGRRQTMRQRQREELGELYQRFVKLRKRIVHELGGECQFYEFVGNFMVKADLHDGTGSHTVPMTEDGFETLVIATLDLWVRKKRKKTCAELFEEFKLTLRRSTLRGEETKN